MGELSVWRLTPAATTTVFKPFQHAPLGPNRPSNVVYLAPRLRVVTKQQPETAA